MSTNSQPLKIVVAETSVIIRSGVSVALKRIPNLDIHPIEVNSIEALDHYAHLHQPDMIIINPSFDRWFNLTAFKTEHPRLAGVKYIALISSVTNKNVLEEYDERFSICDDLDIITTKLSGLLRSDEEQEEEKDSESDTLSQREKEIVTCVVKGMTNKAIAEKLFLSIHTVITHRRNIARKLQIHSPAGLTIYAIVNKLVELSEIKEKL
ncbi:response regulator transcription factor [uncultured Bacteroides sp.]|uniref:response regulator transcription factor n=1 Tax=uncultured Bacteroides sp. TaxID=162156 RepID=UPI002639641B|nr:response regulator transcription factor [uncultured Bacteroides sp.]